jgi:hypothetical protein
LVPTQLAPALRLSSRAAARRLERWRFLANGLDAIFDAMWAGDLEARRVDAVVHEARAVSVDLLDQFERELLEPSTDLETGEHVPVHPDVLDLSPTQLGRRARGIAADLDPESQARFERQGRRERHVRVRPGDCPGTTTWTASLPSDVSAAAWSAVDELAQEYLRARPGLSVDAARADALTDLVLSRATVTTSVELLVPVVPGWTFPAVATASPLGDPAGTGATTRDGTMSPLPSSAAGELTRGPAPPPDSATGRVVWVIPGAVEDPRVGTLVPDAVAAVLADPDLRLRLSRLDRDGCITQDPTVYRPNDPLRRLVRTRDGTCRFPGCRTPAARCDLDHVVPFPHGPTHEHNLLALCRSHHGFKHHARWLVELSPDGVARWISPQGRTYSTRPQETALTRVVPPERKRVRPVRARSRHRHGQVDVVRLTDRPGAARGRVRVGEWSHGPATAA